MGKIVALDFGAKRTGIAITDSLKIIASALDTVDTNKLGDYLKNLFQKEIVECIVVGEAKRFSGEASDIEQKIIPFIDFLRRKFPEIKIERQDERFTSKLAFDTILKAGTKKIKRQDKSLVDKVSATIILQAYLERI